MNAIATSILPREATRPLPFPLAAYYDRYADLADEPEFIVPSKVLRLPAVAVATLRYTAPDVNDLRLATRGLATEASILLAAWRGRRDLTGWTVAEEFQERYYGGRTRGFTRGLDTYRRLPRKGFDLLVATERLGLVQWFADIEDPDDWRKYRTIRLSEALATFERSRS
jgi:hypothetical protein